MNILCVSDIHGRIGSLPVVIDRSDFDLVIFVGDITHLGGYKKAKNILEPALTGRHPVYAVPGNMDTRGVRKYLEETGIDLHGRGIGMNNIGFMGVGGANPTPFNTPFELSEDEIRALLEKGYKDIQDYSTRVLISHAPPHGTRLDRVRSGLHVGSLAVRDFILNKDINYCICGHIHEAAGTDRLGKTYCLNPGAFREGKFSLIEISNNGGFKIVRSGK